MKEFKKNLRQPFNYNEVKSNKIKLCVALFCLYTDIIKWLKLQYVLQLTFLFINRMPSATLPYMYLMNVVLILLPSSGSW
jgi:hypothetical protein